MGRERGEEEREACAGLTPSQPVKLQLSDKPTGPSDRERQRITDVSGAGLLVVIEGDKTKS